jgi:hypothetical protein
MIKQPTTSINTAIRIPTDIYEKIEMQSISEGTNISTIINSILRKYVTWDQFVSDIGFIFLQKPFLRTILEEIPESAVIKAAKTTCHSGMRDAISFIHGKIDIDSIIDVVRLWLSASNLPHRIITNDDNDVNNQNTIEFRIQHNLGKKGSLYFGTLLSTLFGELGIQPKRSLLKDHSAIIIFKISPKSLNLQKDIQNNNIPKDDK